MFGGRLIRVPSEPMFHVRPINAWCRFSTVRRNSLDSAWTWILQPFQFCLRANLARVLMIMMRATWHASTLEVLRVAAKLAGLSQTCLVRCTATLGVEALQLFQLGSRAIPTRLLQGILHAREHAIV